MTKGLARQFAQYMHAEGALATKAFEGGREFIVLIAGAHVAGIVGPEHNGIVVLDKNLEHVILDKHLRTSSGSEGPTAAQAAEFQRILAMDWAQFTAFCKSNPNYRDNVAPDFDHPTPMSFQPPVDREIFPLEGRTETPFEMPLTGRREIIEFIGSHKTHSPGGDNYREGLAWNIKVGAFEHSGKIDGFTPDAAFDERWEAYVQADPEMFWRLASQELDAYTGSMGLFEEGDEGMGRVKLGVAGRSGGWVVLEGVDGLGDRLSFGQRLEMKTWADELEDADLVRLYKLISQLDHELSPAANRRTMAFAYASERQMLEDEWSSEPKSAVA